MFKKIKNRIDIRRASYWLVGIILVIVTLTLLVWPETASSITTSFLRERNLCLYNVEKTK